MHSNGKMHECVVNVALNHYQIGSTTIALICTNLAGIFTHWPRELAQRKAFIETRQCIEARLKTQRENQQQVKFQKYTPQKYTALNANTNNHF